MSMKNTENRILCLFLAVICFFSILTAPFCANAASFELSPKSSKISCGGSFTITPILNGKNAAPGSFSFKSSDKSIATVSRTGKVKALKRGSAKITVTYKANKRISATCSVKVLPKYTVSPSSKPYKNAFISYSGYNKYTKQYYMLRSYLERLEKTGGGTLVLRAGEYNVTNVLYLASNVTVVLSDGVVLKKANKTHSKAIKASQSLIQLVAPSKTKTQHTKYNGTHDAKIIGKGTAVIDMKNSIDSKECSAIVMGHNKNVTIKNIQFKNSSFGHFVELDASKNVLISGCSFSNSSTMFENGVYGGAINIDTPDKKTKGFTQSWTSYDCTPNTDVRIYNCSFKNVEMGVETHRYSQNKLHKNISVKKCTFKNVTKYAVMLMNWTNPAIESNSFVNIGMKSAKTDANAYAVLGSGVSSPSIINNTFDTCEYIMRFKAYQMDDVPQYSPIDNTISRKEYVAIANSNKSVNNEYRARRLFVSSVDKYGRPSSTLIYNDIYFIEKV